MTDTPIRIYVSDEPESDGTFLLFRTSDSGATVKLGYVFVDSSLSGVVLVPEGGGNGPDTAAP